MAKLVYCASPSRLAQKTDAIVNFVAQKNHAPLHPFQAFPYDVYEGGSLGRTTTMDISLRVVHTLKHKKPVSLLLDSWDKQWKKFYASLEPKYNHPIDHLL